MSTCHNIPEKPSTTKVSKNTTSGYSLFTYCSPETKENKIDCYRHKNCMKNFCLDLKEHVTKKGTFEKKQMIPLTEDKNKSYENQKCCYICKKEFTKQNKKIRDHCHYTRKWRGAAHSICNFRYKTPKEVPVILHSSSQKNLKDNFWEKIQKNILFFQYQLKSKLQT